MYKIVKILGELGLPLAYDHFAEGESPQPPFICYLCPKTDNFGADGVVYKKINNISVELYTDKKDLQAEELVENCLDKHHIFYKKTELWIHSEKLYEVLYQFDRMKEDL